MQTSTPQIRNQHRLGALACTAAALVAASTALGGLSPDWHFTSAHPTQNSLNAIWAESADSIYVAGDGGTILHWDGSGWTEMDTPTERPLFSIHGSSGDNIWAVGGDSYQTTNDDKSVVLHYDGTSWNQMPTPSDRFDQRLTLSDVWVQSPTEVWAIVESYLSLFKWDGTQWTYVDFQGAMPPGVFLEGGMNDVQWVEGLGLFMVGTHGQVVHFDGTDWSLEQKLEDGNFSTSILTTIHAVDTDHVYAGHNWGTVFKRNPDGTWTDMELGEGGFFGSGQILDIRGGSPTDLYFFVDRTIRHFTGAAPTQNTEYGNEVRGSWQAADAFGDQLFVVDNQGGVYQFDTTTSALSPLAFSHRSYFNGRLNGATAYGPDQILLYGDGQYYQNPMAMATTDGSTVARYPLENMPEGATHSANVIHAVTRPDGEISLVFDDFENRTSGIYTSDGDTWTRRQGGYFTSNGIQLDYSSSGKLFMCDSQRVSYWNDTASMAIEILRLTLEEAQGGYLTAIWAPDDDRVYVGAYDGQIRRWDGSAWNPETTIPDTEIGALIGDGDHLYAIAFEDGSFRDSGQLWHRSPAGTWSRIQLAQGLTAKPIGFAEGDSGVYFAYCTSAAYFGGDRTFIARLNGAGLVAEVDGLSAQYQAITSDAQGNIFLAHSSGYFLTNRERSETFSNTLVPLDAGGWTGLPIAGVEIAPHAAGDGHSFFVAWRSAGVTDAALIPDRYQPGNEQWHLGLDSARTPENAPLFRFRFTYDPALLPPGFDPSRLVMLRFDGTAWEAVPAVFDSVQGYIETTAPTSASTWVVAIDTSEPLPPSLLSIAPAGPGAVTLSWPAGLDLELVTSPSLEPGSWTSVAEAPVQVGDDMTVTVNRTERERYFRLQ